ncbi:MAG: penicillin-binding protein 2 [Alphaproteobacteria bacterium]|nr:penicillin-binding protein 2 [Alphaproteobacteria bacterium]
MMEAPTVFQRRIVIGAGVCVAAFVLVAIRLVDVTLIKVGGGESVSGPAVIARADLTDRNGELLARDLPVKDLYARPHEFWDKPQAAHDLAAATGADEDRLLAGFNNARHPYVLIARRITPGAEAKVMHLGLPGLEFEPASKRYYPDGRIAAQLLGVTDPDNNGVSGLEMGLQDRLRDAAARGDGAVATSIDSRVQYILAHEVAEARKTFSAHAAGGIVMDVKTGEILAMTSQPDFDPNQRKLEDGDSTRNIIAQDVYELGSIFKIFSFTLAFEDHTLKSLDEVFKIGQGLQIGKYTIHEAERMPATLAARDILAQSSNIGTSQIALRSGGARQREFLSSLGLLKPLKTVLPETARPLYPGANWGMIETATVSFGHGISVSPLSFVAAAASVINGGRQITPTFIRQPAGTDNRSVQVIKPETSAQMRDLLRYVVTNGTGRKADIPGYDVGGKTGSAQVPGPNGHYLAHALRTSFFAAFPVHNPRYVVFVLMDQPHGTKETGGFALAAYTAVPAAAHVIARIAPLLGVPNAPEPAKEAAKPAPVEAGPTQVAPTQVAYGRSL